MRLLTLSGRAPPGRRHPQPLPSPTPYPIPPPPAQVLVPRLCTESAAPSRASNAMKSYISPSQTLEIPVTEGPRGGKNDLLRVHLSKGTFPWEEKHVNAHGSRWEQPRLLFLLHALSGGTSAGGSHGTWSRPAERVRLKQRRVPPLCSGPRLLGDHRILDPQLGRTLAFNSSPTGWVGKWRLTEAGQRRRGYWWQDWDLNRTYLLPV